MHRILNLWRLSPSHPWPTDPSKVLELEEKMWAAMDGLMKKGDVEEFGVFSDGRSGYCIVKGETEEIHRDVCMFNPSVLSEIHEIVPFEKHKEIIRALRKTQIAAMKK